MVSKPILIAGFVLGLVGLTSPAVAQAVDCNGNGIDDACDLDCGVTGGPCDVPGCGGSVDGMMLPATLLGMGWTRRRWAGRV